MAVKKSFVDKVYDSYIKSDYSYGDNNLNPKREIRKDTKIDTEDELNKILSEIEDKVTSIKSKYKSSVFQENQLAFNVNGDGKNQVGTPKSLKDAIRRAGGSGDNLILLPGFEENYPNNLPLDIEMTIAKIIGSLGDGGGGGSSGNPSPNELNTNGPGLYTIRCDGTIDLVTNKDTSLDDEIGHSGELNSRDNGYDYFGNGYGNNNDINGGGGGSSAGGGAKTGSTRNRSTADMQDAAIRDARQKMMNNLRNDKASVYDCALYDLEILKVIVAVLKIIKIVKGILDPGLAIAVETVKLVVLAAQCWNNPTSIGELISRVAEKIVAILVMIVSMLLQMLWNMLGLDCLTSWSVSKIQEIRALLSGISSIFTEVDKTALSLSSGVQKVQDAWDQADAEIHKALEYSLSDRIRDTIDIDTLSTNFYNSALVSDPKGAAKSLAMDTVTQTAAYSQIIDAINNAKSLGETAKGMVNEFNKMTGNIDKSIQKFSEKFEGIQVK